MKKILKRALKKIIDKLDFEVSRKRHNNPADSRVVSLTPEGAPKGNVLLGFIIEPFLLGEGEEVSNSHTHDWESLQMAQTFLDLGYCVDVISYRNSEFIPEKSYSFFAAARTNFERIVHHLNDDCINIVHLDTAHWLSNNFGAYLRLLELKSRRGVSLSNRKMVEENWAIECANYATVLGNEFTIDTYRFANKPIFRVPISSTSIYPSPENKDFEASRKNYLWFGSAGLVHKGLDIVLEAFAAMPDHHLTVCGPVKGEERFEREFYKELYETANIDTIGWVDVDSDKFLNILNKCAATIYPSASEGGGGCVITCMHAGLIPVVNYEASVDIGDFGVLLENCSIDEIMKSVERLSSMPLAELQRRAKDTWQYARDHHTRDTFAENYSKAVKEIMAFSVDAKKRDLL